MLRTYYSLSPDQVFCPLENPRVSFSHWPSPAEVFLGTRHPGNEGAHSRGAQGSAPREAPQEGAADPRISVLLGCLVSELLQNAREVLVCIPAAVSASKQELALGLGQSARRAQLRTHTSSPAPVLSWRGRRGAGSGRFSTPSCGSSGSPGQPQVVVSSLSRWFPGLCLYLEWKSSQRACSWAGTATLIFHFCPFLSLFLNRILRIEVALTPRECCAHGWGCRAAQLGVRAEVPRGCGGLVPRGGPQHSWYSVGPLPDGAPSQAWPPPCWAQGPSSTCRRFFL